MRGAVAQESNVCSPKEPYNYRGRYKVAENVGEGGLHSDEESHTATGRGTKPQNVDWKWTVILHFLFYLVDFRFKRGVHD